MVLCMQSVHLLLQARDVRTVATLSLARDAARSRTALAALETGSNCSAYRTLYTTRVLGDEVKVIVCPAFADSISEGDIRQVLSWYSGIITLFVLGGRKL